LSPHFSPSRPNPGCLVSALRAMAGCLRQPPLAPLLLTIVGAVGFVCVAAVQRAHTGHGASGVDVDDIDEVDVRCDADGFMVFPNGTRMRPWYAMPAEGSLPDSAFTCLRGQIFGISLPGMASKDGVFFYVAMNPLAAYLPFQVYVDATDSRKQFLLVPPPEGLVAQIALGLPPRLAADLPGYALVGGALLRARGAAPLRPRRPPHADDDEADPARRRGRSRPQAGKG